MKTGITKAQTKVESTQLKTLIATTPVPAHALKEQPIIRKSTCCLANHKDSRKHDLS